MTDKGQSESWLDEVLAEARSEVRPAPEALFDRVMRDADLVLAERANTAAPVAMVEGGGLLQNLREFLGGWSAMGGLAAATVAGFWIGVAPPQVLSDWSVQLLGTEIEVQLLDDTLAFGLEG